MSVEAMTWALTVPVGGNAKVVLLGLANHAHPDGTNSYPALNTLAGYAHCHRDTARRNLRELERDGWIVKNGEGPHGQTCYRLTLSGRVEQGGSKTPCSKTPPGGTGVAEGVALVLPEPTTEPSGVSESARASSKRADQDQAPPGFPSELATVLDTVLDVLRGVQAERGGDLPTIRGVGLAVARFPDRDHVRVARELEQWALAGTGRAKPVRDWGRTFATFLDRSPVGAPITVGAARVAPIGRRDEHAERSERRLASAERLFTDRGAA